MYMCLYLLMYMYLYRDQVQKWIDLKLNNTAQNHLLYF